MIVKEVDLMKGLFSSKNYSAGEVVYIPKGEILSQPTRESIQVAPGRHINIKDEGQFINHSCRPNCEVKGGKVIAIRPIIIGDEITFDYNHSEDRLSNPFICNCCNRLISGRLSVR